MDNNVNAINSNEKNEHKGGILERIRNSSRKVIAPVIAAGSISLGGLPAATIPVTGATAVSLLTACSSDEPDNPLDTTAPTVNVNQHDVDITGGKQIRISGNQLYIGDMLVASRTDNVTKNCKVELSLNGKTITSGTTITEEGLLTVKVTDDAGNSKTIDIKLSINNQLISGLENLQNLNMKVDQEVNLLNGIIFGNGASLVKVEVEMDGQTTQIVDPQHYTPEYPGTCTIILTVKDKNGNIVTEKVNKSILALEYSNFSVDKADLMTGLKSDIVYGNLIAEGENHLMNITKTIPAQSLIVEMLENGTATMSPAEIKNLLGKNEIIMIGEDVYQATGFQGLYEWLLDSNQESSAGGHGDNVGKYLMTSIKKILQKQNKKFKIYYRGIDKEYKTLSEYVQSHPQSKFFLFSSAPATCPVREAEDGVNGRNLLKDTRQAIKKLSIANNVFCIMGAIGNIKNSSAPEDEGALIHTVIKVGETDTPNSEYTIASDGGDAAMGGDNNLVSHSFTYNSGGTNSKSMHPSIILNNNGRIWSGTSNLYNKSGEASSRGTPKEAGDLYVATCINMMANPNITSTQNRELIRKHGLVNQVLVDGQPYCTTITANPGGMFYQLYPQLPNSINLNSENLVKIPHGLYKNSVVVGPGIVDQNGSQITKSNYKEYIGKDLYFSPKLLKKYGIKAGERKEYTIYLCTDTKGTGAWNNNNQANKSIDSQTVSVSFSN